MAIRIHPHARERMKERGTLDTEIIAAVAEGEQFPVQFGRNRVPSELPIPA